MSLLVRYEHEKPEIAPGQVLSSVPYFLGDLLYAHKIMEPFKAKAMLQKDTLHLMCQITTGKVRIRLTQYNITP